MDGRQRTGWLKLLRPPNLLTVPGDPLAGYLLASVGSSTVDPMAASCAAIAALSISGLPLHRFAFEGFLPPKTGKRKNALKRLAEDDRTLIVYESPYRIVAALRDMLDIFGDRPAVLTREMTKLHEEVLGGTLAGILEALEKKVKIKGEITLLIAGKEKTTEALQAV